MEKNQSIHSYEEQATKLSADLWDIANTLRGSMDASKFKNYILGIIFYRYLSEHTVIYMNNLLKDDGVTYEEAWEMEDGEIRDAIIEWSYEGLGYVLEPKYLFKNIVAKIEPKEFHISDLEDAVKSIEASTLGKESRHAFEDLFDDMDLSDKSLGKEVSDRTTRIASVLTKINDISFNLEQAEYDILGTAYMILIGLFASDAGKKGGEFYTPAMVSKLCAKLATLDLKEVKYVCDPTCGSASMLLELRNFIAKDSIGHFYGQELNSSTYNLARMNMIMHAIHYRQFSMYNDDVIKTDNFDNKEFTIQVANPPYSQKWTAEKRYEDDPRFSGAGKLPPKSYEDLAFLEHMIHHMDKDGRVVVLLPHGVLFRGGAEAIIRRYIVETRNLLDAVIGLPANCFHGTSIPVACLVLKRERENHDYVNKNNIFFVDASMYFTPGKQMNYLSEEDIDRIVNAYIDRRTVDKFCSKVRMEEIISNDYNLNISRYVDNFEVEKNIDLDAVQKSIIEKKDKSNCLENKISKLLKELGIEE